MARTSQFTNMIRCYVVSVFELYTSPKIDGDILESSAKML